MQCFWNKNDTSEQSDLMWIFYQHDFTNFVNKILDLQVNYKESKIKLTN